LPKSTSAGPSKNYHTLAKPYETLAQIFESGTASRLKSEADAGASLWRNDSNTGLVLQVLAAYQRFQIRDLANVYSKISIPELVGLTTSAETGYKLPTPQAGESLVQTMIQRGDLNATLSRPPTGPSILTFSPSGTALTEPEMQRELAASTSRIQALTKEIKQTDRMLTHDKDYIKFVQKLKKNKAAAEEGPASEWNEIGEDEDIMAMY
jgi:COP9 signalosome complex subunit 3